MTAYYNEHDPFAAQWLRVLIAGGHIAPGVVDERSIEDVRPSELEQYTQCHFFAGIGGWSYALRLAGWPDDRPVWTGSCPCQPFSAAGKGAGVDDERHLWPEFRWLIDQCRPPIVFGEQVASKDGREWFAGVRSDLERMAYRVGAADLCAASTGAPHIRQRLWWVADTDGAKPQGRELRLQSESRNVHGATRNGKRPEEPSGMVNTPSEQMGVSRCSWEQGGSVDCQDGKQRRIEPGSFPLAHGVSNRVGLLRGYGNAVHTKTAKTFIEAYLTC